MKQLEQINNDWLKVEFMESVQKARKQNGLTLEEMARITKEVMGDDTESFISELAKLYDVQSDGR